MKNRFTVVLLSLCVAAPGVARAQSSSASGVREAPPPAQQQNMFRGSKIIGADVVDPQQRKLGEIKDILLDSGRGEISFVVVSFGGPLTLTTNQLHAVPWQALQPADDGKHYVLYADRETVSKAPAFDARQWPNLTDRRWSEEVDRYWMRMVGRAPPGGITNSSGAGSAGSKVERGGGSGR